MLLKYHKDYTQSVINPHTEFSDEQKTQIKIGATVNDLCELATESYLLVDSKRAIHDYVNTRGRALIGEALFHSHFGDLTSLHVMAKKNEEAAHFTRQEVAAWFDFLSDVAIGNMVIDPGKKVVSEDTAIKPLFRERCANIEYKHIFDSINPDDIQYRALGMMLHLIEDAYTPSHCERDADDAIVRFCYYAAQDRKKHEKADDVPPKRETNLIRQCKNCVTSILNKKKYDYTDLLILSDVAENSSGGNFAKK